MNGVPTIVRKRCRACSKEKPLTEFRRTARGPGGFTFDCNDCRAARPAKHSKIVEQAVPEGPHIVCSHSLGFTARLDDQDVRIEQRGETIWLSHDEMARLVGWWQESSCDPPTAV